MKLKVLALCCMAVALPGCAVDVYPTTGYYAPATVYHRPVVVAPPAYYHRPPPVVYRPHRHYGHYRYRW